MDIDLTTPALLFPAISLLMLGYTNRFLSIAGVIRALHDDALRDPSGARAQQVSLLRGRIVLIKYMQTLGSAAFLLCACTMYALYVGAPTIGAVLFGSALLVLCASLVCALLEALRSTDAIEVEISDLERGDLRAPSARRADASDGRFP